MPRFCPQAPPHLCQSLRSLCIRAPIAPAIISASRVWSICLDTCRTRGRSVCPYRDLPALFAVIAAFCPDSRQGTRVGPDLHEAREDSILPGTTHRSLAR